MEPTAGPEIRITATPPRPAGVARATIVFIDVSLCATDIEAPSSQLAIQSSNAVATNLDKIIAAESVCAENLVNTPLLCHRQHRVR